MSSVALVVLIGVVALVYASVGHGGASGYLAAVSLFGYDPAPMATTALILNLLVAGLGTLAFWRAGHFSWSLTWPFLVTSIPAAMLGGWLPVARSTYDDLLAFALLFAAVRLWLKAGARVAVTNGPPRVAALSLGAGIGVVSGIVGVGGGIFLSPLLVLCRWADAKRTAATSAVFIVLNSLAALAGRLLAGRLVVGSMLPLMGAAVIGGLVGSRLGANHFSNLWLCRVLGSVLAVAAVNVLRT